MNKSPRDYRDAELLALRAGKQLVAADADYERFSADLKAIRGDYQCEISAELDKGTGSVLLKFNESSEAFKKVVAGEYKGLDCLNAWYGGRIGHVMKSLGMVTVHFDHIFDRDLIAGAYASQAGIKSASPGGIIGRSSDITLCSSSDEGTRRYALSKGSGDCPSGCIT